MASDPEWLTLRLYTRHPAELLRTAHAALEQHDGFSRWFFIRYWNGGPHVRLRLKDATADAVQAVLGAAEPVLRLERGRQLMAPEEYRRMAVQLARLEDLNEHDSLQAGGTVRADRGLDLAEFGSQKRVQAVERHFQESSELALSLMTGEAESRLEASVRTTVETWLFLSDLAGQQRQTLVRRADDLLSSPMAAHFFSPHLIPDPRLDARVLTSLRTYFRSGPASPWTRGLENLHRAGPPPPASQHTGAAPLTVLMELLGLSASPEASFGKLVHLLNNRLGIGAQAERHSVYLAMRTLATHAEANEDKTC